MSAIDSLRNKSLVEYIQGKYPDDNIDLQPDGTWRCSCSLHGGENTSSFAVFPNNRYYCFSCNRTGDLISYVMERTGLPFYAAIKSLAEEYGIDLSQDTAYVKQRSIAQRNEILCREYESKVDIVKEYLTKKRGLTEEIIAKHRLGYGCPPKSKDNALTIPMYNLYGTLVGFGFRFFDSLPKYKNTPNNELYQKGSYLYNIEVAARMVHKTKRLYIVEGHIDALSIEQMGEACVAYCGITFSREHVGLVQQITERVDGVTIIIVPDNDGKASKFVDRGRMLFAKHYPDANVRVAILDGGKDANDLLLAGGNINDVQTEPIDIYCCKQVLAKFPDDRPAQSKAVAKYIKTVHNQIVKAEIAGVLAKEWEIDHQEVKEFLHVSESITTEEIMKEFKDTNSGIEKYMQMIRAPSYTIGFAQLDASFRPIRDKHVILIGAYSKVGKTDFMIEILLHSIVRLKMMCMVFTMEMSEEAFWERLLCKLVGVNSDTLAKMMLGSEFTSVVEQVKEKLEKYLTIIDTNGLTIQEIEERVRLAMSLGAPVKRVFVDYFQYMRNTTEYADVARTARYMKEFVKKLNCQLVMLSQFNREGNNYDEPSIRSFRGGNDMESSFDKAVLLWRPGLKPGLGEIDKEVMKYETWCKIIDRDGLRGGDMFKLYYNPKTGRLQEVDWRQGKDD